MKKLTAILMVMFIVWGLMGCSKVKRVSYVDEEVSTAETESEEEFELEEESGAESTASSVSKTKSSKAKTSTAKTSSKKSSSSKVKVTGELQDTDLPKFNIKGSKVTYLTTDTLTDSNKSLAAEFKKAYNAEIVWTSSAWNDLATNLSKMVLANNAPDLVTLRSTDFPLTAAKGLLQSYDGKIDLNTDLWKGTKKLTEENKFRDKKYILISNVSVSDVLWYNKNLLRDAGITKLPNQLYEEKKWDWDTLISMANEVKDPEAAAPVYGLGSDYLLLANDIMAQRGTYILKVNSDGKQELTLTTAETNEAMALYSDLYFKHKIMCTGGQELALFLANRLGFFVQGSWLTQTNNKIGSMYQNGTVGMVPIPSWKGKTENHKLVISQHAIPKGAKNVDGGLALASYLRYLAIDKSTVEEKRGEVITKGLLTAKEFLYLDQAASNGTIMPAITGDTGGWYWKPYNDLQGGTPWSTVVPRYLSQFQKCVDEYNASFN